jgi:hypothetical protein
LVHTDFDHIINYGKIIDIINFDLNDTIINIEILPKPKYAHVRTYKIFLSELTNQESYTVHLLNVDEVQLSLMIE